MHEHLQHMAVHCGDVVAVIDLYRPAQPVCSIVASPDDLPGLCGVDGVALWRGQIYASMIDPCAIDDEAAYPDAIPVWRDQMVAKRIGEVAARRAWRGLRWIACNGVPPVGSIARVAVVRRVRIDGRRRHIALAIVGVCGNLVLFADLDFFALIEVVELVEAAKLNMEALRDGLRRVAGLGGIPDEADIPIARQHGARQSLERADWLTGKAGKRRDGEDCGERNRHDNADG